MKSTDWKFVVEVVGIAAIVASLIFVGMEMRQTRVLAMAATYQARSDSEISIQLAQLESRFMYPMVQSLLSGTELSEEEGIYFRVLLETRLMYWENAHYQWENGLLTDQFWTANENSIRAFMLNGPANHYWASNRHLWRESFQIAVDKVMREWDERQSSRQVD